MKKKKNKVLVKNRNYRIPSHRTLYLQINFYICNFSKFDESYCFRYLLENYHFIDGNQVMIWGWGYGGYVALRSFLHPASQYKCGIAINAITTWKQYGK